MRLQLFRREFVLRFAVNTASTTMSSFMESAAALLVVGSAYAVPEISKATAALP